MIIDKLEERLTIRYPSSYIKKVHIDKADKDYVLRYRRKDIFADLILYDVESSKPISTIEYDLHGDKCYISYFKTDYDYQGKGIGKFLYQLAQAHADKLGLKFSDGYICPVDDIKGVSSDSDDNVEKEFKFLALMYHALGNKIIEKSNFQGVELTFEDNWKHGQKIKKLDENQKEFLEKMVEYEMKQNQKYLESKNKKDKSK